VPCAVVAGSFDAVELCRVRLTTRGWVRSLCWFRFCRLGTSAMTWSRALPCRSGGKAGSATRRRTARIMRSGFTRSGSMLAAVADVHQGADRLVVREVAP
jgi:hypothetical protein